MKQKLVIKVGTSILSNGDALALERIENLCAFIAHLQEKYNVILVSSGAVAIHDFSFLDCFARFILSQ